MVDFLEQISPPGEKLIGFRSSFNGAGFATEWPQIDLFGRTGFYQADECSGAFARLSRMGTEASVTRDDQIEDPLEAQVPDGLVSLCRGPLHQAADEVEGNDAHPQRLVRHIGAFHIESLHAEGGLEVAQFQLEVPSPGRNVRQINAALFLPISQGGHDDEFAFLSGPVLVAELDETKFESGGQGIPLLACQRAATRMLRAAPGDEPLVGGKSFAFPPVQ